MSARLDRLLARKDHLFVPLSFRLSAKLEQMDWEELTEDPVYTTFALRNGQKLFRADGVINWFDTFLEAEAAGVEVERDEVGRVMRRGDPVGSIPDPASFLQEGEIPLALDVARRLCEETLDESAVLGYVTGPQTLLKHLLGEDKHEDQEAMNGVGQLSLQLAREYCEAG